MLFPLTYSFLFISQRREAYGRANRHPNPSRNAKYGSGQEDCPNTTIPDTRAHLLTCTRSLCFLYNLMA